MFYGRHRGAFVYGRAWRGAAEVELTIGDAAPVRVPTSPAPKEIGGRNRYWVAPLPKPPCGDIRARALDYPDGELLGEAPVLRASLGCRRQSSRISTSAR